MEKNSYLFVYGTLRKEFHHFEHKFVSDYFVFVNAATVKGKLYNLESYPAAIITDSESFIKGELYQLQNEEDFYEAFAQLDDYEEFDASAVENSLFRREIAEVQFAGKTIHAWIYWYNRNLIEQQQVISGDILNLEKPSKII